MANASAGLIARDADWSDSTAKTKNIFGSSTRNSALQLGGMVFQLDLGVGPGVISLSYCPNSHHIIIYDDLWPSLLAPGAYFNPALHYN